MPSTSSKAVSTTGLAEVVQPYNAAPNVAPIEDIKKHVGQQVETLIRANGRTLADAANLAGKSESTLRNWFAGASTPDAADLWRMCRELDLEMYISPDGFDIRPCQTRYHSADAVTDVTLLASTIDKVDQSFKRLNVSVGLHQRIEIATHLYVLLQHPEELARAIDSLLVAVARLAPQIAYGVTSPPANVE